MTNEEFLLTPWTALIDVCLTNLSNSVWVWVLCYDRLSVGQSVLEETNHLGFTTRFVLLSDSCGFVEMRSSLWREDRSITYNCCWFSTVQSFSGPSPVGLATIFYSPQIRDFPFRRFLRLAGSRWRYSTPPPHGTISRIHEPAAFYNCHAAQTEVTASNDSITVSY
jgi:hypothetical protein